MAYYHTEPREIPPPPDPPVALDATAYDKAEAKKAHDAAAKATRAKNAARTVAIEGWVSVVIDSRTGHEVCVCEGPAHAEYIAGLLNDRPPR